MAPFHLPTSGTAGRRNSGRLLMLLRTRAPSCSSLSDEDPPQSSTSHSSNPHTDSNNAPRSSLNIILSRFRVARRVVKKQPTPTTNPDQTDGGTVEVAPPESEPQPLRSPQQTSQTSDTETVPQPRSWLVDELASPDTRASSSASDEDSSSDSIGDDANSYIIRVISCDMGNGEELLRYVMLGAYDPKLKQPIFFLGTCDTAADVCMLSYEKARLLVPEGISDNFANVGELILDGVGCEVTARGPISVKFWLQSEGSRIHCEAPFYVLPPSYPESGFDALLDGRVLKMFGLM